MHGRESAHDKPALLAAMHEAFSTYERDASLGALERCIDTCQRLIPALDETEVEHGNAVLQLAEFLGNRWTRTRSAVHWAQAAGLIDEFRARIPPGDWREPLYALAQGALLYRRADATQAVDDIANALGRLQEARAMVRYGSFVHRLSSLYQGNLRLRRFEVERDPGDLEAALADSGAVLASEHTRPAHVVAAAKTFARAAYLHADLVRADAHLDFAVDAVRRALTLTNESMDIGDLQGVLGSLLRERFARGGRAADIDDAIEACRTAAQLPGLPDTLRAARLDNLGNAFAARHGSRGDVTDLDAMIDCHRQALRLSPAGSPDRARIHANLARSLLARWRNRHDPGALNEAQSTLMAGLCIEVAPMSVTGLLNALLLEALLESDLATGTDAHLDQAIAAGEAALRAVTSSEGDDPVTYRLAARARWSPLARRLVGALLRRAERHSEAKEADLRRAVAIGEAAKVPLLTRELLRRSLAAPADVEEGSLFLEKQLLAELAAYDVHDMAPADKLSESRRLRRIAQRRSAWGALEQVWDEICATGPAGAQYVRIRRDISAALDAALQNRPPDWLLLSMLDIEELSPEGRWQQGFCVIALPPGNGAPLKVLCSGPHDAVSNAQELFQMQVLDDPEADPQKETWWCGLGALVHCNPADGQAQMMFSTNSRGLNLPWQLLFERTGWRDAEGAVLPVVVVPSLVLVAEAGASGEEEWQELRNSAEYFGVQDDSGVAENVRVSLRMPAAPSKPALVVGDPLRDLEDASDEAVNVAQALSVEPLLGPAASIKAVRDGFHDARIVHIAAHASFNDLDPLASVLRLADGDLSARDLIGSWSTSELVVLSACESGTGAPVLGGEAVGLAIELLRSGVQGVIASLWPVDDEATAFLMRRFYSARVRDHSNARALAKAMSDTQRQPAWKGPYYWAGFVLVQRGFGK
jgi:hypothetical protein